MFQAAKKYIDALMCSIKGNCQIVNPSDIDDDHTRWLRQQREESRIEIQRMQGTGNMFKDSIFTPEAPKIRNKESQ